MREGPGDRSNVKRNALKRFMKITKKKKKMERRKKGKQKTYMLVEKKTKRLR